MKIEQYIFRIDRLRRTRCDGSLGGNIAELAKLLGSSERRALQRLRRGSVQVVSAVELEAQPSERSTAEPSCTRAS